MSEQLGGLTDDERAELEALRAEKARREQEEKDAAERAELERLRAEKAKAEAQERASGAMEPDDDDLSMPLAQKIVLIGVVVLFAFAVWRIFFSG